jgi:AcrR family transcriptional regulator
VPSTRGKVTVRPDRSPVHREKYAQIVDAAARLFAVQGFNGTSLQDISEQVGVLKGSLYHYITSKEDLLLDIVRIGQQGLAENLDLCKNFAGAPLEELVAFAYGHFVLNATPERLLRGIVYIRDGDKLSPAKRRTVVSNRDKYDRYLRSILSAGRDEGLIDPDVDPRICGLMILGVLNSYHRWYKPGGQLSRHELGREFAAFVLAAVREHISHGTGHRWEIVDEVVERCRQILADKQSSDSGPSPDEVGIAWAPSA